MAAARAASGLRLVEGAQLTLVLTMIALCQGKGNASHADAYDPALFRLGSGARGLDPYPRAVADAASLTTSMSPCISLSEYFYLAAWD